jgi:hypothetical protein
MRDRVPGATDFPDRQSIRVESWLYEICSVPVLVDSCFSEDDQAAIPATVSKTALKDLHPRLRSAIREIVAPLSARPAGSSAATATPTTGRICLWCNRSSLARTRCHEV